MKFADRIKISFHSLGKNKDMLAWVLKYGIVLIVFLFFFLPIHGRLSNYQAERSSLRKQIDILKKIVSSLLTPEEIERVRSRVEQFESKLADETKTASILNQITTMCESNHLKLIQIYSDSPVLVKNDAGQELQVEGKKLNLLPVNFRVESDYKSLANFLHELSENSKWTFTVESLSLQRSAAEGESLQCDITLSFISR